MSTFKMTGEDCRLMGVEPMGAGFLRRQARRASRVVRPLIHEGLNVASIVPGTSTLVSSARKAGDLVKVGQRIAARQVSSILKDVKVPEDILKDVKTPTKFYIAAAALTVGLGTVVYFASRPKTKKQL